MHCRRARETAKFNNSVMEESSSLNNFCFDYKVKVAQNLNLDITFPFVKEGWNFYNNRP